MDVCPYIGKMPVFRHQVSGLKTAESNSPGEFHPQALTEPDVSLSTHPALIDQPNMAALLPEGASSAMQS